MVLAQEPRRPPGSRARPHRAPTRPRPLGAAEGGPGADEATRAAALRRIVAEVSSSQDLDRLFQEVIDASFTLFGADRAGLWIYDDSPAPLTLAAQRGLSSAMLELIASLPRDAQTVGMTAIRERHVTILAGELEGTVPRLQRMYRAEGIRSMCFVPIVFRDEVLGLLVLYHRTDYEWSDDETDLARSFGDHIAVAMQNARLAESSRALAERLGAISELAVRLNRIHDIEGIAASIVGEAGRLIDHDTIRVYRVDHATGVCEPIAFQGTFLGSSDPDPDTLRVAIGEGLTGWVAEHNETVRSGDAGADPRGIVMGSNAEPESMLAVPMAFEDVVHGVVVVSKRGRDRFDADDETTFGIFASYAAQALVNASNVGRLQLQQAELHHQLASQRRLLEVNERLLSTLEPNSVLDLIADSLKVIVPYDTLTIYRVDRAAGVRRAVIARDRFADLILAHESPLGVGISGWVVDHGEAVLANEAHLDPRSVQVPGTPFEPESMIVVPLLVGGEAIGTLNIGRMGEAGGVLHRQRVRSDQAVRGAGLDRAAERRDPRRGARPRGARRPHRDPQPRRFPGRPGRCRAVGRERRPVRGPDDGPRRLQGLQRHARAPRRRCPADRDRAGDERRGPRRRPHLPLRRRRVRGHPAGRGSGGRPRGRRAAAPNRGGAVQRDADGSRSASACRATRRTAARRTPWWPSPTGRCTSPSRPRRSPMARPSATTRTCAPSTRRPSPCSTGATLRCCSRRS